jgi:hypothetical protein
MHCVLGDSVSIKKPNIRTRLDSDRLELLAQPEESRYEPT